MEQEVRWKKELLPMLPNKLGNLLRHVDDTFPLEELRIRANMPVELCGQGFSRLVSPAGGGAAATQSDCRDIFERICGHSVYAWEDELKNGFITLKGGYRAGLGGHIVRGERGSVMSVTDISSINIRIARPITGAADGVMRYILRSDGTPFATLIISPPGQGKTTMLRDIIRQLSWGVNGAKPQRISVVDERMELAGSVRGAMQFDLGPRTDILSACSKPEGIRMAVRALSPEVVATDELGTRLDADAVREASFSGVYTIATAHADGIAALKNRAALQGLLFSGAIERVVELRRKYNKAGCVTGVYDANLEPVRERGGEILCFERC